LSKRFQIFSRYLRKSHKEINSYHISIIMYKVKSSKTVYKSQWMIVYEDSVIDEEQGRAGIFNRINVNDAATIVPVFEDGSLLMVENYRHGVNMNLLELPGGLIRGNEVGGQQQREQQPSDTAKRELLEETGYTCNTLQYINWFYTWPGRATQRNFVFIAKGLEKIQLKQRLEEFEYIEVCKLGRMQVMEELRNGRIKSAVTISALLYGYFI
jgi:ADP-ribose pyrophosphatase